MSKCNKILEHLPPQDNDYDEDTMHSDTPITTGGVLTSAAVLHERLTVLTECWGCQLLFNELPSQK